ncbi:MAG: DnaK suppressor protein [Gammaproteobacteria bacterium]
MAKAKTKVSKKTATKNNVAKKKTIVKNPPKKVVAKKTAKKAPAKKTPLAKKKPTKVTPSKKVIAKKKTATKQKAVSPKPAETKVEANTVASKTESTVGRARPPTNSSPLRQRPARKSVNLEDVKIPLDFKPSKKEEYMGPEHLLYFKQKLQTWRDELIAESQETLEHLRTETRDVGDEAERASRESDNILELRTRDRYRKLLRKIEEALRRVDDGAYGYCEETGEEIGLGRLEARPIATLTVDAQERREMFQKQFRDDR